MVWWNSTEYYSLKWGHVQLHIVRRHGIQTIRVNLSVCTCISWSNRGCEKPETMTPYERRITGNSTVCSTVCSGQHLSKFHIPGPLWLPLTYGFPPQSASNAGHYHDVIMTTTASQITSLTVVYSTVYSDADQRKHQSSASLAFVWGIHRDRRIPRTKGQLRGKCCHLMTSSWSFSFGDIIVHVTLHCRRYTSVGVAW